jgi:hypothetical protein
MVNLLAIGISSIAGFMIGMLWYSPLLFGKIWMKAIGLSEEKLKTQQKSMSKTLLIAFISQILMAYVLASLPAVTFNAALLLGIMLWAGFIVTTMINPVLWQNQSVKVYLINIGHYFCVIMVMVIILNLWK